MNQNEIEKELGIENLPDDQKKLILSEIYNNLDMKIGILLADNLTEIQIEEFQSLAEKNNVQELETWLRDNFPDYKKLVQVELINIISENKLASNNIIESSK